MTETTSLLQADEPSPVLEHNAPGGSPFLIACDHYGRLIPRVLGDLGVPEAEQQRHIGWDIGIAGVATLLSNALNAHLIAQRYSRLVIDCNRPLHVASSIPIISEATRIPGNEGLTKQATLQRRRAVFEPYHARISQVLDRRAAQGRPTALIALHSFTPVYAGIPRPWHIGTLYEHDTRLPRLLLRKLRDQKELVVGDNEPYAVREGSDFTIPVHGQARGLVHSGIEIRQDLIVEQAGQKAWAERLARVFTEIEPLLVKMISASASAPAKAHRQS